ncbi:DUF4153 domain-containing protein [Achromobacter agilis]|uniref:DUF4153 domain-containing protein n=1 Tax=Achromobacter agilis TaxID=1353888 RepID=A0A446CWK7_9BURK|nr:DUF4153 domain-containing protein [Achromobacter agilis]SSW72242.1 hypothetical protein AGI3411_05524 [Achromobacter agilis]
MTQPAGNSPGSPRFDPADRTVLIYGALAALFGLTVHALVARGFWPSGRPYALAYLTHAIALVCLAGALLAGMRSGKRWLVALAAYGAVLPALGAYGFGFGDDARSLNLLMTGIAAFVLLPLVQQLDARQPQWNYPAVFRAAWRNTVHLAVAGFLTLAVCLLLWGAGQMFQMIGIAIVAKIIGNIHFMLGVWPLVAAACLVGVRRRPQLTETLQRSWLTLNAWLLPLVTVVGLAFTLALAARLALGLEAVTLSAGAIIAFSLIWIKLINAAWQDGEHAAPFGPRLRRLLRAGMVCLLPLAAVALYGIAVRVNQYGWTDNRVWGAYCAALVALYGLGYAWAALRPARYYTTLAATNLTAAAATLALLALINTPVAAPARVAADSQLQRLIDGRIEPHAFRYFSMENNYGRWGREALRRLADGAANDRDPQIAVAASMALENRRYDWKIAPGDPGSPANPPAFAIFPAGHDVPPGWWEYLAHIQAHDARLCAEEGPPVPAGATPAPRCALMFADVTGDGRDDLILYIRPNPEGHAKFVREMAIAYAPLADGQWRRIGTLTRQRRDGGATGAPDLATEAEQGQVRSVPRQDRDLLIGDDLLRLR